MATVPKPRFSELPKKVSQMRKKAEPPGLSTDVVAAVKMLSALQLDRVEEREHLAAIVTKAGYLPDDHEEILDACEQLLKTEHTRQK